MDVSRPERSLVPTLDGAVLLALAGTNKGMTAPHVHRVAGTGSVNGVRRVLARLVDEGLALADQAGQAWLYRANRDHVTWPAVEVLVGLRPTFLGHLRRALTALDQPCVYAGLFGSAARADSDSGSDIDLLLVRPDDSYDDQAVSDSWNRQTDLLGEQVLAWTGNDPQVFETNPESLAAWPPTDPLLRSWQRDLIDLVGRSTWDLDGRLRVDSVTT